MTKDEMLAFGQAQAKVLEMDKLFTGCSNQVVRHAVCMFTASWIINIAATNKCPEEDVLTETGNLVQKYIAQIKDNISQSPYCIAADAVT